MFEMNFASPSC